MFRTALLMMVVASLLVPALGSAQVYVEGRVGVAIVPDSDSTFVVPGGGFLPSTQSFGVGATGGVAVGYGLDFGLRPEVNLQVQGNDFALLQVLGYVEPKTGEAVTITSLFDLLYDIRIGDSPFVPFVGAGVGLLYTTVSPESGAIFQLDGDAISFAWEVVGGIAWELSDRLAVTANYRYLDTTDNQGFRVFVPLAAQQFWLRTELSSHNVTAGLRYTFSGGGGD